MLPRVATLNVEILWLTSVPVDWPSRHSFSQSAPRENLPYGAIASFGENQVVVIGANEETCGCCGTTTSASVRVRVDRKSTRLNSSHANISYAVFCLKTDTISVGIDGGTRLDRRTPRLSPSPARL